MIGLSLAASTLFVPRISLIISANVIHTTRSLITACMYTHVTIRCCPTTLDGGFHWDS